MNSLYTTSIASLFATSVTRMSRRHDTRVCVHVRRIHGGTLLAESVYALYITANFHVCANYAVVLLLLCSDQTIVAQTKLTCTQATPSHVFGSYTYVTLSSYLSWYEHAYYAEMCRASCKQTIYCILTACPKYIVSYKHYYRLLYNHIPLIFLDYFVSQEI